jgi:rare lipoprotein A
VGHGPAVARALVAIALGPGCSGAADVGAGPPRPEPVAPALAPVAASAVAATALALAPASVAPEPAPGLVALGAVLDGNASWYGRKFHGHKTAYGEKFDMHAFTAASLRFPYGAKLRVERVGTGRVVEVRVNDRPGKKAERILDLSRAAAEKLDMIRAGVVPVRVTVVALR